ncbi:hypothetical protein BXZ70DRAFT_924803 [Cristinia sonorae]|uniref:F-box domain-containing protein n=1 Tax=Cristinia sonorae TaxID=1940300 RepID=A0A8K0UTV4_9AGAR|nr:hypothetical protein BXZ70DRAFT_924803 [Cristinia sonorae]
MHKIFLIPELVHPIVHFLTGDDSEETRDFSDGGSDLLCDMHWTVYMNVTSLGLASRVFRRACLDAIWERQTSLVPLLRSIPGLLKKERYQFHLQRGISQEDIVQIMTYSSRIRWLGDAPRIDNVSVLLDSLPPSTTLFPNLRYLSLSNRTNKDLQTLVTKSSGPAFTGLRVYSIIFHIPDLIRDLQPQIIFLSIQALGHFSSSSNLWTALLDSARHLRRLDVCVAGMSWPEWQTAAQLPVLTMVDIQGHWILPLSFPSVDIVTFTTLTTLKITAFDLFRLVIPLQHSSFPALQHLRCTSDAFGVESVHSYLHLLTKAVISSCSPTHLTELYLGMPFDSHSSHYRQFPATIPVDCLSPLLQLSRLRSLHIDFAIRWELDDECVLKMARAWPDIAFLSLNPNKRWAESEANRVTLHGLLPLVTSCPYLEELGIPLAVSQPIPLEQLIAVEQHAHPLRRLSVSGSPLPPSAIETVGRYLARLFPQIKSLSAQDPQKDYMPAEDVNDPVTVEHWKNVFEVVRSVREAT